ncbi:MAG TPA: 4Fe-4S dicluster domain-containing protein [Candidatus Limnocylindrales bacterium]|nr:4Fe-4S dicluster domain-containing protein [Candidatus Limnocylindrales bacterium]
MARTFELVIDRNRCKGCSMCIKFCPRQVITLGDELNNLGYNSVIITDVCKCTGYGNCYKICPELVFEITEGEAF